ncbi:MAG: hypothetical protein JOY71_27445 [Acetobacteraceae bacterium]|nr:hypothetical protein [Acetobacteraceae bacterium]
MSKRREDAGVTIGEEIECLMAAGWRWDGDTLKHPQNDNIWITYRRADSRGINAREEQFESELKLAVRKVQRQGRERREKLLAAKAAIEELLEQSMVNSPGLPEEPSDA